MSETVKKQRLSLRVTGAVQGVGFRPFVYRLAAELELTGWVCNSVAGLEVEVEGPRPKLEQFLQRIETDPPPPARIRSIDHEYLAVAGYREFTIKESDGRGPKQVHLLPDLATCEDCLAELTAPENRRYHYPFINCTNCGPRYSIIRSLPYDRPRTTMAKFEMCEKCQAEYETPLDRRFHAQPNACPQCGPRLRWTTPPGESDCEREAALEKTVAHLQQGKIVALKGLGGFHLLVDARDSEAVNRLRERKQRAAKSFALIYPSLARLKQDCHVNSTEAEILNSPESPILLLEQKEETSVSAATAPDPHTLGVMLPYTPLHHLVLGELGYPLVATSGNLSGEPICTENGAALERLADIADGFLLHDRPIERPVDDSVGRVINDELQLLRRARGYAPAPLNFPREETKILALGGQLKNTVGLTVSGELVISQHLGDLETSPAINNYQQTIESLEEIYEFSPEYLVADLHPDYYSTKYAEQRSEPVIRVQHHHAHVASAMLEHDLSGSVFGVAWDGSGFGPDETVWGGEFLRADRVEYSRLGRFRQFPLPGGEQAVREPRRSALGLLYELDLQEDLPAPITRAFSEEELQVLGQALENEVNTPLTSSVGRLFDAATALVGLSTHNEYLGQAPVQLEKLAQEAETEAKFSYKINRVENNDDQLFSVDWGPLFREIIAAHRENRGAQEIAAQFHNTLASIIVDMVCRQECRKVVLTGGCFQNYYLTKKVLALLAEQPVTPYIHKRVPANDGGISAGQATVAAARLHRNLV